MSDNIKTELTFSNFRNFKPMVFAKSKKVEQLLELRFVMVTIPVPNGSYCISGKPELRLEETKKTIRIDVLLVGEGDQDRAGSMLHFFIKPNLDLPGSDTSPYELNVIVKLDNDTRPQKVGHSVVKTIDEED